MYSSAEEVSVSTVAATATATGHHMLKIHDNGYSRLQKLHDNGCAVTSCDFQAAGHTWQICFFPNGVREEDAGFVSVLLQLARDAAAQSGVVLAEY